MPRRDPGYEVLPERDQPPRRRRLPPWAIVLLVVGPLLVAAAGVAGAIWLVRQANRDGRGLLEDRAERLDLVKVSADLRGNKPAAMRQYQGRLVEVDIVGVMISGGDADGIWVVLVEADSKGSLGRTGLMYKAWFSFGDPRNAPLKDVRGTGEMKTAQLTGTVRGRLSDFQQGNPFDDTDVTWVMLNPAHLVGR